MTDGLEKFNEISSKCVGHTVHFYSNYLPLTKKLSMNTLYTVRTVTPGLFLRLKKTSIRLKGAVNS